MNVRQAFLQDAEESQFDGRGHAYQLRGQIEAHTDSAALGKTFDVPAGGRIESGLIEQRGVEQV